MEATENAKNTNVDDLLQQTELGSFIARNKTGVIAGVVVLLLLVVGYGFYSTYQQKQQERVSAIAYDFSQKYVQQLTDKKITPSKFVAELEKVAAEGGYHEVLSSLLLRSFDLVYKEHDFASAQKIMDILTQHYLSKNAYLDYFILVRSAAVLEDQKRYKPAVDALKRITSLSVKVMEAKTYLDLGRLYMKLGNKEKAKSSFFYVIDNYTGQEFAKIAKIYLAKLQ